jgi:hypothetical protein
MDYVTYANEYIVELRGAAVPPRPTDGLGGLPGFVESSADASARAQAESNLLRMERERRRRTSDGAE